MRGTILLCVLTLATLTPGCARRTSGGSEATITRAGAPESSTSGDEAPVESRRRRPRPSHHDWRTDYAQHPPLRTFSGAASYYHDSLAGRSTASGEPYEPRAFTAANRDLPFGTVLRVVRRDTGASVIVKVNDRGPFGRRQRVLDLSRAAAEELDMVQRGVIEVHVEVLEDGPPRRRR